MSLSEQLERGIATLEEHVKGELPVEISVTYSSSPGGIRGMRFSACVGGILDNGRVYELGDSVEQAVCKVIEKTAHRDIVAKIRMERLKALAEELGVKISILKK